MAVSNWYAHDCRITGTGSQWGAKDIRIPVAVAAVARVLVGGVVKTCTGMYVLVGGAVKQVTHAYTLVGGAVKTIF